MFTNFWITIITSCVGGCTGGLIPAVIPLIQKNKHDKRTEWWKRTTWAIGLIESAKNNTFKDLAIDILKHQISEKSELITAEEKKYFTQIFSDWGKEYLKRSREYSGTTDAHGVS